MPGVRKPDEDPVNRWLPLYRGIGQQGQSTKAKPLTAHTGLLFEKFCDVWAGPKDKDPWKPESPRRGRAAKHRFFSEIACHVAANNVTEVLLSAYLQRRGALISALRGCCCTFITDWRLVSGLGMGHPLETGFVWHRTLGVPYLPGSSVKGLIRAWAERWGGSNMPEEVVRLFGPRGEEAQINPAAGSLIVFDALPIGIPKLEVDIMNPHYAPYYQAGKPPADYYPPRPIFFLAVAPGQTFEFALAPRSGNYRNEITEQAKTDLERGMRLLQEALENIGAGGKTAVGYGYFKPVKT